MRPWTATCFPFPVADPAGERLLRPEFSWTLAGNSKLTKSGAGRRRSCPRRRDSSRDHRCGGRQASSEPARRRPAVCGCSLVSAGHHTPAWPRLRRRVLTRDRHTCQDCRRQGLGRVEVHHQSSICEMVAPTTWRTW